MRDWQKVYRDQQQYRAEIVRSILDENELSPVMLNKKDSAYQFGHFEVLVAPEHVIKALKIINEEIRFE
jgi:hypothetical protein